MKSSDRRTKVTKSKSKNNHPRKSKRNTQLKRKTLNQEGGGISDSIKFSGIGFNDTPPPPKFPCTIL